MANKKRGQVSVSFKGKPLKLSLSFNSFCELEDHYGQNITDIVAKYAADSANKTASLKDARALLWASMLEGYPDASLKDAGVLAEKLGHEKLGDTVADVLNNCGLFDAKSGAGGTSAGKLQTGQSSTA